MPAGQSVEHCVVGYGARRLYQCKACRHQALLTAGTVMASSKLPPQTWFLAYCLISQGKTGLSFLALTRQLGTSYRTAWLVHHKLIAAMAQCDVQQPLDRAVQLDDAYLGGERLGVGGRGSLNKVPLVAAVSTKDKGHPMRVGLGPIKIFGREAVATWAKANLLPGCDVRSDGLACFARVINAGCAHSYVVVGSRIPRELPRFSWVNIMLGNLKTMVGRVHKWFRFSKYAQCYFGAFAYRFNNRFDLGAKLTAKIKQAATQNPTRGRSVRGMAEVHD